MNWNDLKYLLAVHRKGTLSAASIELGVNQTTVARRLSKLEKNIGVSLLQRTAGSLALTIEGLKALDYIEAAEDELFKLEKLLKQDREIRGALKITAVDSVIDGLLMPGMADLLSKHPDLQLTFQGSTTNLNIDKFEADIAIRLARPQSGSMIISKLSEIGFAVYGPPMIAGRGLKNGLNSVPWVAFDDNLSNIPEMKWLAASYPDVQICLRSHTATSLAKALESTPAVGILPCFLGGENRNLIRLSGDQPILSREAWLITHQDTYQTPRIRAAIAWLKMLFSTNRDWLNGNKAREYP